MIADFKVHSLESDSLSPLQGFSVQLEAQCCIFIKIQLSLELGLFLLLLFMISE